MRIALANQVMHAAHLGRFKLAQVCTTAVWHAHRAIVAVKGAEQLQSFAELQPSDAACKAMQWLAAGEPLPGDGSPAGSCQARPAAASGHAVTISTQVDISASKSFKNSAKRLVQVGNAC